ncbi:hypothetical protein MXAN_4516 [Myxococcus xanthus DK 1622]|uniref:Uncharacterized protein n=1 Tax=Myxococcus xanthus (strain DK1622) TaxID=246197 RepID=Q1D3T9_MYXXD|nr:hypothetical protein MXAN_4516 [Myxococcus xanthus DK 1622]
MSLEMNRALIFRAKRHEALASSVQLSLESTPSRCAPSSRRRRSWPCAPSNSDRPARAQGGSVYLSGGTDRQ